MCGNKNILTDTEKFGALCPQHINRFLLFVSHKKWPLSLSPTLQNGEDGITVT